MSRRASSREGREGQGPHRRGREEGHHLGAGQEARTSRSVMGVQPLENYDASKHNIVSNASCTTNCTRAARPRRCSRRASVLTEGLMTTVHSYYGDAEDRRRPVAQDWKRRPQRRPSTSSRRRRANRRRRSRSAPAAGQGQALGHGLSALPIAGPSRSSTPRSTTEKATSLKEINAALNKAERDDISRASSVTPRTRSRLLRLHPREDVERLRRGQLDRAQRELLQAHLLVRQRVGLQQPLRRPLLTYMVKKGA